MTTASERWQAIKDAHRNGYPELAVAIDNERTCCDCGGFVSDDGVSVDLTRCCRFCEP